MEVHKKTRLLILDYLKQHPKACDTVEGIANWWVRDGDIDVVEKTVQCMVDEHILSSRHICGNAIFSMHRKTEK